MLGIRSRKVFGLVALSAAVALVWVGCGSGGDDTTAAGGGDAASIATQPAGGSATSAAKVDIADFKYGPSAITVKKGGSVTWTNSDDAPHTATQTPGGSGFDTGTLDKGASKTVSFADTGTFPYVCSFHAFMHGTVRVVG